MLFVMVPVEWKTPRGPDGTPMVSEDYKREIQEALEKALENLGWLKKFVTRIKVIFQRNQNGSFRPVVVLFYRSKSGDELSFTRGIPFVESATKVAPDKADIVTHLCVTEGLANFIRTQVYLSPWERLVLLFAHRKELQSD